MSPSGSSTQNIQSFNVHEAWPTQAQHPFGEPPVRIIGHAGSGGAGEVRDLSPGKAQSKALRNMFAVHGARELLRQHDVASASSLARYADVLGHYVKWCDGADIAAMTPEELAMFHAASEVAAVALRTALCRTEKNVAPLLACILRKERILDRILHDTGLPLEELPNPLRSQVRSQYLEIGDLYSRIGEEHAATDAYLDANLCKEEEDTFEPRIFNCAARPRALSTALLQQPSSPEQASTDARLIEAVSAMLNRLSREFTRMDGGAPLTTTGCYVAHALTTGMLADLFEVEQFTNDQPADRLLVGKLKDNPNIREDVMRNLGYQFFRGELLPLGLPRERESWLSKAAYVDYRKKKSDQFSEQQNALLVQLGEAIYQDYAGSGLQAHRMTLPEIFTERLFLLGDGTRKKVCGLLQKALADNVFPEQEIKSAMVFPIREPQMRNKLDAQECVVDVMRTVDLLDGRLRGKYATLVYPRHIQLNDQSIRQGFENRDMSTHAHFRLAVKEYVNAQGWASGATLSEPETAGDTAARQRRKHAKKGGEPPKKTKKTKKTATSSSLTHGGNSQLLANLEHLMVIMFSKSAALSDASSTAERCVRQAALDIAAAEARDYLALKLSAMSMDDLRQFFANARVRKAVNDKMASLPEPKPAGSFALCLEQAAQNDPVKCILKKVPPSSAARGMLGLVDAVMALPTSERRNYRVLLLECHNTLRDMFHAPGKLRDAPVAVQAIDKLAAALLTLQQEADEGQA